MTSAFQNTGAGRAGLRDLAANDVDSIVEYWHDGIADLDFLGIDRARLGERSATHKRFADAIPTGDAEQSRLAFAITLDGAFVGYTLLNRYSPEVNFSHWHIVVPEKRAAGISTSLYPHRIKMYFDAAPGMQRLTHQTRTRNIGVNRMLDKFVPVAETLQVENPDGVALPGEFHIRYVRREDVPRLFERLKEISLSKN
jgi:hypothetical protein